jgi:hypothetical protein
VGSVSLGEVVSFPVGRVDSRTANTLTQYATVTRLDFLREAKQVLVEEDYHELLEAILDHEFYMNGEEWLKDATLTYYNLPERI